MKKIPTLFERQFEGHKIIGISDKITTGCENAFLHGKATLKIDGSCCAIINGVFYKRFDCKKGKKPPMGAIPCCPPDPITGHHPHWVRVDESKPEDKWFTNALLNSKLTGDGTYEAIGIHFQGNPYNLDKDILVKHGLKILDVSRTFEDIKNFLEENYIEGIVFWLDGEPVCKIKRSDFGFEWGKSKSNLDLT